MMHDPRPAFLRKRDGLAPDGRPEDDDDGSVYAGRNAGREVARDRPTEDAAAQICTGPTFGAAEEPSPVEAELSPADNDRLDAQALQHDERAGIQADVKRLAALSPLEYDRRRQEVAERLGVRVSTLDAEVKRLRADGDAEGGAAVALFMPEPWPWPVNGAELLSALAEAVKCHLVVPAGAAEAVALWVLHAHLHETAAISPILAVTSPTPECGKTTLLTILGALVPRPLPASNITAAALFRAVEKWQPTLLVDEADTFLRSSDELRGVLNSGHNRMAAYVIRTVGDDHEPRRFGTWAPKAIALIGKLPATLASRSIHVELRRIAPGEEVVPIRADRLHHLEPLARKAVRWALDNELTIGSAEPDMPKALAGRRADNWRHLLAIADAAGGDWPERARRAAETLSGSDSGETAAIMLLADIEDIFKLRAADKIASKDMADALAELEDRPWAEWKAGKPITPNGLAKLLAPFKIKPKQLRFPDGRTGISGYTHDAFADAFTRYLPDQTSTPLHSRDPAASGAPQTSTRKPAVEFPDRRKSSNFADCRGVEVQEPEPWEADL
jgi:hypothetical protein